MKKHIILFAVAALTMSAACSKVDVETPEQKIGFEVASYVPQTKATEGSSLITSEGLYSFTTNAWFYPTTGTQNQHYMNSVVIYPYNGTTKIESGETQPTVWQSEVDYYWPKTGYINFFSFAGTKSPSDEGDAEYGKKLIYGGTEGVVIAYNDNILVADAVFHATQNTNDITVTGETATPSGVPTLFRHQLAKVGMTVMLETSNPTTNTSYEVVINSATLASVENKGILTLTVTEPSGTTPATAQWSNANTSKPNVGWVPGTGTETFTLLTPTLTLAAAATESTDHSDYNLLATRTVMPQALQNAVVLTITYTVSAKHDGVTYSTETITVTKQLNQVTGLADWEMNKNITYTVKIDPVAEKITFDPAVVDWVAQSGTVTF